MFPCICMQPCCCIHEMLNILWTALHEVQLRQNKPLFPASRHAYCLPTFSNSPPTLSSNKLWRPCTFCKVPILWRVQRVPLSRIHHWSGRAAAAGSSSAVIYAYAGEYSVYICLALHLEVWVSWSDLFSRHHCHRSPLNNLLACWSWLATWRVDCASGVQLNSWT